MKCDSVARSTLKKVADVPGTTVLSTTRASAALGGGGPGSTSAMTALPAALSSSSSCGVRGRGGVGWAWRGEGSQGERVVVGGGETMQGPGERGV